MAGPAAVGPPPGLLIRSAEDRDAADVAALVNLIGQISEPDAPGMTAESVRCDVLAADTPLHALVAELDGTVVGCAVHQFAYECAYRARGRFLTDLAVDPRVRRRGVGRALLARVARLTQEEGGAFLWWLNAPALAAARPLYRRIADIEDGVTSFAATRDAFRRLAAEG